MHHTDRVKLQFGILQGIPDAPICMDNYHTISLSDQWSSDSWKNFQKEERRHWRDRANRVLQGEIMSDECKPTQNHMN
jgi:hypothetical protein